MVIFSLFFFCKYYFAPIEYQTGAKGSRFWFSYTELIVILILMPAIIIPLLIFSKIVRRVYINSLENILEIEYIDRFRISPKTVKVKLSETQIQIEEIETRKGLFEKSRPYLIVHLYNKSFKKIIINDQTFSTIDEVVVFFEELKIVAARTLRKRRLSLGKNRRRQGKK